MPGKLLKRMLKVIAGIILLGAVFVISLVVYIAGAYHQPLVLPSPTGPYSVGRTVYDWVDHQRIDPLSDTANRKRELLIWIWYPAKVGSPAQRAPYLPPAWAKANAADNGIGVFLERDYALIQTHSYLDAPVSDRQSSYPILILQPGMGPAIPDYTVFAENLASHGYIVVGINETETQFTTVFPDGRVILRSSNGAIPDNAGPVEAEQDANRIGKVWTEDAIFVMNQLDKLNQAGASPFSHKLDLTQIGVFGHSFGGATAIAVCQADSRCKAGVNLDGTPLSDSNSQPIQQPFLFLSEGYRQPFPPGCETDKNCQLLYAAYQRAKNQAYFVTINGAGHFNFTDRPYRSLSLARLIFKTIGIIGPIQPERGLEVTNAYLVAFFDRYLAEKSSPLLSGASSNYPEVQMASHGPK